MNTKTFFRLGLVALVIGGAGTVSAADPKPAAAAAPEPETILCTFHVKPGQEQAFTAVLARTWALYRRLDLVVPKPHVLARGADDTGKPYFVEIFTWRDSAIPDHAPAEVQKLWAEMNAACEPRGGRPGIDFSDGGVTLVGGD